MRIANEGSDTVRRDVPYMCTAQTAAAAKPTPHTLACGLLHPYPPTAADLLLKVRLKSRYWRIVDGEMFTQEVRCGWLVSRPAGRQARGCGPDWGRQVAAISS